mmetsp:Transcript_31705/g.67330  ORF Transcript_31705/g.67330 Transcript_31705/m.67330 type:complete len:95 (-) Transcript_31705:549-833(-)
MECRSGVARAEGGGDINGPLTGVVTPEKPAVRSRTGVLQLDCRPPVCIGGIAPPAGMPASRSGFALSLIGGDLAPETGSVRLPQDMPRRSGGTG